MKHAIIGTAGHVDHGKTTLIQALTGSNPDRLKEEQERGMTIDIGFAALKLPDGTLVGIVDVPGHERFLKNMLAGASGVDVVLLVVAADESVMPQTREHLDILRLLDVKNGVVALTKCDMVDAEWIDTVEEDVRAHLEGTFLEKAPILRISAHTKRGINALKSALLSAVSRSESRNTALPFRLPIDRVFTRPGFGTVVTGTLVAGILRVGDAVEIAPQGIATRVRGLQVHGQKVTEAEAGNRVAVNIANVETDAIERGAQLTPPKALAPTEIFDAVLRLLPNADKPLKDRARVRIHIGTAEILGRVRLLDSRDEMEAGGRGYIQFRAETPFACARGDRFVLRSYSPMHTLGGGVVLDTNPPRHRKANPVSLASLEAKERGTPEDLVDTVLQRYPVGLPCRDLAGLTAVTVQETDAALTLLEKEGKAVRLPTERAIHATLLASLTDRALSTLTRYHEQYPLRLGMPKEEFRAALGREAESKAFQALLKHWQETFISEGSTVRLADFQVTLNERQIALLERIEAVYRAYGIATPTTAEVCREVYAPPDAVNALLRVGVERGKFHTAGEGIYYDSETLDKMKRIATEQIETEGGVTVAAFRDATQSNRKFAVQALEYLDSIHFTQREGDTRTRTGNP